MGTHDVLVKIVGKDESSKAFLSAISGAKGLGSQIQAVGRLAVATTTSIIGIGTALGGLALKTAAVGDELNKMSNRTGISVEDLSALKTAAELGDASLQDLGVATRNLQKNMADAARGTGEAKDQFKLLGFTNQDLAKYMDDPMGMLAEMAKRMQGVTNQADKTNIAMKVFGRSGTALIPMLDDLANRGMAGLTEESKRLGTYWTKDMAQASTDMKDNMDRVMKAFTATAYSLGVKLIPVVDDLLKLFMRLAGIELPDPLRDLDRQIEKLEEARDIYKQQIESRKAAGFMDAGVLERLGKLEIELLELGNRRRELANEMLRKNAEAKKIEDDRLKGQQATTEELKNQKELAKALLEIKKREAELQERIRAGLEKMASAHLAGIGAAYNWSEDPEMAKLREAADLYDKIQAGKQKALEEHFKGLESAFSWGDDFVKPGLEGFDKLKEGLKGFSDYFSRSMVDMLWQGKITFQGLWESFAKSFLSNMMSKTMTQGLTSLAAAGGGGGIFGSILNFIAGVSHSGSIVGSGGQSRMVPAMAFLSAPRYHGGGTVGLAPDERAIVAKVGEGIYPPEKMAAMKGPTMQMTVYNDFRGADPGSEARIQLMIKRSQAETLEKAHTMFRRGAALAVAARTV